MDTIIYHLFTPSDNNIFYVGRTNNLATRLASHIYHANRGDNEHKYIAIREFDRHGVEWRMREVSRANDEDWQCYIALRGGHLLTNMCRGSIYTAVDDYREYFNAEHLAKGLEYHEKQKSVKRAPITLKTYTVDYTRPIDESILGDLGSDKPPAFVSPGLQKMLDRKNKK